MAAAAFMAPPLVRAQSAMDAPVAIMTTESLVNAKADAWSSLYEASTRLKARLWRVPALRDDMVECENEEQENPDGIDIVTALWNLLRLGTPLVVLFNALDPPELVPVDNPGVKENQIPKAATFKFLAGCMGYLKFRPDEVFLITDLFGRDTTGFIKVLKVIDRVLDILEQNGKLLDPVASQHVQEEIRVKTRHQKVIDELVTTEKDYGAHLNRLLMFKEDLSKDGNLSGDVLHEIFNNIGVLLDLQQRFCYRLEQQDKLDPKVQNWGKLFSQYAEAFRIYRGFITNQYKGIELVQQNWDKIRLAKVRGEVQGMVTGDTNTLCGFLLKPLQRLCKYPLLLDALLKDPEYDPTKKQDLIDGKFAMEEVIDYCNEGMAEMQNQDKVKELSLRVEDWKGHKLDRFGALLLHGQHSVLKSDVGSKGDKEREYHIFLFECILLCCKETNPNKTKNRLASKNAGKKGVPSLQLKGRIFMQNVTNVIKYTDAKAAPNKPYQLQIYWKGDPGIENFQICFSEQKDRDKWWNKTLIQVRNFTRAPDSTTSGTSQTEFTSLNGANLQNPYEQEEDNEEDLRLSNGSTLVSNPQSDYPGSKNASTTSLRSRSATGGSGGRSSNSSATVGLIGRGVAPPRFPLPDPGFAAMIPPPLKISTSVFVATPDDTNGHSYFSPTAEGSPSSLRSSAHSSHATPLSYNRHVSPPNNPRPQDGHKHNTAPPGTYQDRHSHRPHLAGGPQSTSNVSASQPRSRSLSSPDIQNQQSPSKRYATPADEVPVPPIPPHMLPMRGQVSRSQTSSPTHPRGMRSQTPVETYAQASAYYGAPDPFSRSESRQGLPIGPGPTPHGISQRMFSPAPPAVSSMFDNSNAPYQLKVRIRSDPNYATIVVPSNIKYKTLVDRIDAKMEKMSSCSIAKGTARLRWFDDGSLVSLTNDEDIQGAFDDWKTLHQETLRSGGMPPDIEFIWHEGVNLKLKRRGS